MSSEIGHDVRIPDAAIVGALLALLAEALESPTNNPVAQMAPHSTSVR